MKLFSATRPSVQCIVRFVTARSVCMPLEVCLCRRFRRRVIFAIAGRMTSYGLRTMET